MDIWYAYALGTVVGFYFGYQFAGKKIAASTIDALIEKGFLRWTRSSDGEIEILKWNE